MSITKAQAQTVISKMKAQYPNFSFGLGKDGEDWTVEVRDTDNLTVSLPSSIDGVKVRFCATGQVKPLV